MYDREEGFDLEIIKVPITLDQVGQADQGKAGATSKNSTTPFEQILALFQSIGSLTQSPDGGTSRVVEESANTKSEAPSNRNDLSADDLNKLEGILAAWIIGLQQVQSNTQGNSNQDLSSEKNAQVTNQNQLNLINTEGIKNIENWLQSISQKGDPSSPALSNELLDRLSAMLELSKSMPMTMYQGNQKVSELKNNKTNTISQILDHSVGNEQEITQTNTISQMIDPSIGGVSKQGITQTNTISQMIDPSIGDVSEQRITQSNTISQMIDQLVDLKKGVQNKLDHLLHFSKDDSTEHSAVEQMTLSKPQQILDRNLIMQVPTKTVLDKNFVPIGNRSGSPAGNLDQSNSVPIQSAIANPVQVSTSDKSIPTLASVVPVSQFAPEMSEWVSHQIRFSDDMQGTTEAKFSLYPEHLGQVEIKITSNQGQISAEIVTNTLVGKEAIEGQLQDLKYALQQHGFTIQKLDVSYEVPKTNDANTPGFLFSGGGSNPYREQSSNPSRKKAGDGKEAAIEDIETDNAVRPYGSPLRSGSSQIDFTA